MNYTYIPNIVKIIEIFTQNLIFPFHARPNKRGEKNSIQIYLTRVTHRPTMIFQKKVRNTTNNCAINQHANNPILIHSVVLPPVHHPPIPDKDVHSASRRHYRRNKAGQSGGAKLSAVYKRKRVLNFPSESESRGRPLFCRFRNILRSAQRFVSPWAGRAGWVGDRYALHRINQERWDTNSIPVTGSRRQEQ